MYQRNGQAKPAVVAEQTYDISSGGPIRFSLDWDVQSIILDFAHDAQGNNPTGQVNVFANGNAGGLPWAVVYAGGLLCRPIAVTAKGTELIIVPLATSKGLLHVTACRAVLAPGRF